MTSRSKKLHFRAPLWAAATLPLLAGLLPMAPAKAGTADTAECQPAAQVLPDRGAGAEAAAAAGNIIVGAAVDPQTHESVPVQWVNGQLHVLAGAPAGTSPVAVNTHGVVVLNSDDNTAAFTWANGQATPLKAPPSSGALLATGINDRGEVSGFAFDESGSHSVALRWLSSLSAPRILPSSSATGTDTGAYAINNGGSLAGSDGTGAVRWLPGLVRHTLRPPTGSVYFNSDAWAINDYGATAGTAGRNNTNFQPVVWASSGSARALGVLPGDNLGDAWWISNAGYVAGDSSFADEGIPAPDHGWVWPGSGPIRYLPVPHGDYNTTTSTAFYIDDSGTAVGNFAYALDQDGDYGPTHAIVWHCAFTAAYLPSATDLHPHHVSAPSNLPLGLIPPGLAQVHRGKQPWTAGRTVGDGWGLS